MKTLKDKNIGQVIRVFRTAAGMKQKALAEIVEIQPNSLSLIESGKREPSLALLRSIAKALDIPISLLFWENLDYSPEKDVREITLLTSLRHELLNLEKLRLAERFSTYKKMDESR